MMANEIQVQIAVQVNNPSSGGGFVDQKSYSAQLTQNTLGVFDEIPTVPTTAGGTAYTFTNLATPGWAFLQNLDSTNYVDFGVQVAATFYPFLRLNPSECALLRLSPGVSLYGLANTASVKALIKVWND